MTNFLKKKQAIYLILLGLTILISLPLFNLKMLNGDDAVFHFFRYNTLASAFGDGELIPMIKIEMMGNLGYGANLFYGVLPIYLVYFLSLFLPTVGLASNIFIMLTIFFSGLFMYHLVKDITNNKRSSLLVAFFYMANPYHLYDIYYRGAVGEIVAFVFIPILFQGFYNLINQDKNKSYLITISIGGLLLTHNVSVLMAFIFGFGYLIINFKKLNKIVFKKLIFSLLSAFLIGMATILPLLEAKLASDYMVFDSSYMHAIPSFMKNHAINFFNWQKDNLIRNLIFIYHLVLFLILFLKFRKNKVFKNYFILTGLSLIFCLNFFVWNFLPQTLSIVQYPWRYLQYVSFFISIILAIALVKKIKSYSFKRLLVIFSLILLPALPFIYVGFINEGISNQLLLKNKIVKRGQIARSVGTASAEYLPRKVIYNYEYLKNRGEEPLILSGSGSIVVLKKQGTRIDFEAKINNDSVIELPYIYYPGYIVKKGDLKIKTFETKNGLVGINLSSGKYNLSSRYRGSYTMIVAYIISGLSIGGFTFYIIRKINISR